MTDRVKNGQDVLLVASEALYLHGQALAFGSARWDLDWVFLFPLSPSHWPVRSVDDVVVHGHSTTLNPSWECRQWVEADAELTATPRLKPALHL